jgi:hypothetical protein
MRSLGKHIRWRDLKANAVSDNLRVQQEKFDSDLMPIDSQINLN